MSDTQDSEEYEKHPQADYPITEDDMWDYLEDWKLYEQNNEGKNTRSRSREAFRKFCYFVDEETDKESYKQLTEDDMHEFVKYLLKQGLSHLNVRNIFGSTREFLKQQDVEVANDINLNKKPYDLSKKTLAEEHLKDGIHYLTIEEHKKMLDACESLREKLTCELLWATGIRRTEYANIQVDDVTPEENKIWIDNAKNDDWRHVFYGPRCADLMDKWLNYGRAQYAKSEESDYLICTSYSEQVQDKYANEIVKRVADRAGLLTVYTTDAAGRDLHHPTAHSYRHSFAVHRLSMNLKPLSDLLGHQSTDTTADQYLHLRDKGLKEMNDEHRPKF